MSKPIIGIVGLGYGMKNIDACRWMLTACSQHSIEKISTQCPPYYVHLASNELDLVLSSEKPELLHLCLSTFRPCFSALS